MTIQYYIYSAVLENPKYKKIENSYKYILALMYSYMDKETHKVTISQKEISVIANSTRSIVTRTKSIMKEKKLIEYDNRFDIYMKIPEDKDKIYIDKELVIGKYKDLSSGSKLFYSYFLKKQIQKRQNYIHYKIADLMKPFAGSHKTTNKYCKELIDAGLLKQVKKGLTYIYHFVEIE